MRDWDVIWCHYITCKITIWITLPMRDWDVGKYWLSSASIKMDYITYEGLRPCSSINKFFGIVTGLHYLWGIETTIHFFFQFFWIIFGLHYLWGIETFSILRLILLSWYGLHYLWGIETIWFLQLECLTYRITLPMRDWDIIRSILS